MHDLVSNLPIKAKVIRTGWCWQKKQTYRSMKQKREYRNRATYIWPFNFQQRQQDNSLREKQFLYFFNDAAITIYMNKMYLILTSHHTKII